METISQRNRKLLYSISDAADITTDKSLYDAYASTTDEKARGYLECFASHAQTQDVLLAYFLLRMLTDKKASAQVSEEGEA